MTFAILSQQHTRELPVIFLLLLKNISELGEKMSLELLCMHVDAKCFVFVLLVILRQDQRVVILFCFEFYYMCSEILNFDEENEKEG